MEIMKIVNDIGIPFTVRIVDDGAKYGKVVQFYDARYVEGFTKYGQFVSDYYLFTLQDGKDGCGLDLDGGIDDWYIDGKNMDMIREWLWNHVDRLGNKIYK